MTGMPCPEDHSDESLRRFYRELCRAFHPDKQSCDTGHQDRAKHFFQTLTNVYDMYTDENSTLDPPDADDFLPGGNGSVDHDKDSVPKARTNRNGRRVYLVTFSNTQGDKRRSPAEFTRQQFAELLVKAFETAIPQLKVAYLAVFQERHGDGTAAASRSIHYHASVKSTRQHLWAPIAAYLRQHKRVYVHFAVSGEGYHSAFRYGWWPTQHKPLSELDKEFLHVDGTE
jgi:hypothetical protein